MKHLLRPLLLLAAIAIPCAARAADGPVPARPILYDTNADAKIQIAAALKFGANWCGWCHKLSGVLKTNTELSQLMKENYILVLIDVDKQHNADTVEKYGKPTRFGLPALVVLDTDGTPLHTQDTGKLEDGNHHDPAKLKEFLEKWRKPKPTKG
jgi:thiol-disulfide isomerase/thioredoxin